MTSPPAIELTIMPLFPRTKSKTNKQSQPQSQSPQDRNFLGRESTSSITSDNELLAMSYAKARNDPSPSAFAVGGGIGGSEKGTLDAIGGNSNRGDDATTNSDEQVKNLPKSAFSTFLSPAERKRRAQQKAKEAESAKNKSDRDGGEDGSDGGGGGGGTASGGGGTGKEGSNSIAIRPPSQSQPSTSVISSSFAAAASTASAERDESTDDKDNDNATTSSDEQVKNLPKAAFSTFLSPAERKRRALEKQLELQKKLQQKEEEWGTNNTSNNALAADNEKEEEEKREIVAGDEEQFDIVPEVSAAIPRRPSPPPPPAAKLTTPPSSNISSISSSNHNSNHGSRNPESELPITTSSSPFLVTTSNHQSEIPEESESEKAKRRAIQNVMRDSSLSFVERNERIQKIMKGDFPVEEDEEKSPSNTAAKTVGTTSSVKSASSSAQPAAITSSAKPATTMTTIMTHDPSEIPDESDKDLQKRKAIQQVMRDTSLSAIQRHEKIQKIIQGDFGELASDSVLNSSSSSESDFDSNELEDDDEELVEAKEEEESEVTREPLEPGTHNEPVAPLAVSKSVTGQLEPMAPLIKTKSVAFASKAASNTTKVQEDKKKVAFAEQAVDPEESYDEKNGDAELDWATAAAIGAGGSVVAKASMSSGAASFWQKRDEAERKRKEEERAAAALSNQQEMERKRKEEVEAAALLRQKELEHQREIELLEQKRERELLELKIRMEEESELKKLQQQRELELQHHQEELELQRQRALEEEAEWKKQQKQREMELQQQIKEMEMQQQKQREELELKMQRQQAELELQRQMEMEIQRQRELELEQQQRELEFEQEMERQRQAEAAERAKEEKRLVEERRRHMERQQLERQQQQQQQQEQQRRLQEERERDLHLQRQQEQDEQAHAARAIGSSSTASSPAVAPNHSNFTSLRPSALLNSRARGPHYARTFNYDPNPSSHDGVPDEELNWRLDSYVSLSDFTIVVQRALPGPLAPDFDGGNAQGIDFILDSDGSPRTDVYHVHKVMLAVGSRRSEYLGRLIREADGTAVGWGSSSPDNHSSDITVHETVLLESAASAMGAVLDFCYYQDRELDINLGNAVPLVYLAKRYKIRALLTRADAFVKNNLESSNSVHFLLDSYLYQLDDILSQAIAVTAANLANTVDFEPIYALPPELFRRIILSWKLECDSELLSLVVYSYCGEHNRDEIDVDYFREITTPNLMPILDSKVAMMMLKFYVDLIFEDDSDVDILEVCKDDSLIKRCIEVISQNWRDEVCEPLMIDSEWDEASPATRRNLPPHEPAALHRQLPPGLQNMLLEKCILEAKGDVDSEKTVVEEYDGEKEIELKKTSAMYDEMVIALQTELAKAKSQRDEESKSHMKEVEDLQMKALELEAELDKQKRITEEYKQELKRFRRVPGIHNFGEVSQSDRSIIDKTKCTYSANPEHHYPLHRRGKRPPTQMPRMGVEFENLGRENGYIYDDGNGERLPVFYYQDKQSGRF
mmetsp:Transcript_29906/g.58110  ORF Transcript_29906/g.58110 Transcript_29906/m.58110 type:complete len:1495 (-) Transcript_29906:54-4538(-)